MLQVPECPSAQVPEFPRMQMPWVPKCLSALWVPERLECQSTPWALECPSDLRMAECPSAQIPFKYPWNAHWRPSFSLSALRAKKVWNITRNGLGNSFIEFLKTFQNKYFYEAQIFARISPKFLVWNFFGNAQFFQSLRQFFFLYNNIKITRKKTINTTD